jgi:hypothetical protein
MERTRKLTKYTSAHFVCMRLQPAPALAEGWTMQEATRKELWVNRYDDTDYDLQLKQALESLESENSLLKKLVVRLSETIIRNVTAKR